MASRENTSPPGTASVLFVCMGNICRSPLAEGVFRHLVAEAGLADRFTIDSAGTGAWHAGERPDGRSVQVAAEHGITLEGRARQVTGADLRAFDVVVAMDRDNLANLQALSAETGGTAHLRLLRSFDGRAEGEDVPDPYYGGPQGFETVYHMVRSACEGLLEELRSPT
jgi:protein-tyrosine phosphatase